MLQYTSYIFIVFFLLLTYIHGQFVTKVVTLFVEHDKDRKLDFIPYVMTWTDSQFIKFIATKLIDDDPEFCRNRAVIALKLRVKIIYTL